MIYPSHTNLVPTKNMTNVSWASTETLSPGDYFFSIGQPEGACSLFHNEHLLVSNSGSNGSAESNLFFGHYIQIKDSSPQKFELVCEKNNGGPLRLRHNPYLGYYRYGMLVHFVRFFSAFLFPFASILFIFTFLYIQSREQTFVIPKNGIISCIATTLYLASLCMLQYLFLPSSSAFFIHTILKVFSVFSLLSWVINKTKISKLLAISAVTTIIFLSVIRIFFHESYIYLYKIFIHCIPVIGYVGYHLLDKYKNSHSKLESQQMVGIFIAFAILDCIALDFGKWGYFSSAAILSVSFIAIRSYAKTQRAKNLARKAVGIIASSQAKVTAAEDGLKQIAIIMSDVFKSLKWSIYLDAYLLGAAPRPGVGLRRISSSSEVTIDSISIDLEGGSEYGIIMKEAIELDHPIIRMSPEESVRYMVIPILDVCCINIREIPISQFDELFLENFMSEAYEQIKAVAISMVRLASASSLSTAILREELGIGTHDLQFGAIFSDASGYTQNVNSSPSFVEFFEREYVPTLLRSLGSRIILKDLFGDELYLVVLPESGSNHATKCDIFQSTLNATIALRDFSLGVGAELCQASGYKPIEFKTGSNAGLGKIIVTPNAIALSGPVIEAKRCQGRSKKSEPFITSALLDCAKESLRDFSIHETYAAKKEILDGYRIGRIKKLEVA